MYQISYQIDQLGYSNRPSTVYQ